MRWGRDGTNITYYFSVNPYRSRCVFLYASCAYAQPYLKISVVASSFPPKNNPFLHVSSMRPFHPCLPSPFFSHAPPPETRTGYAHWLHWLELPQVAQSKFFSLHAPFPLRSRTAGSMRPSSYKFLRENSSDQNDHICICYVGETGVQHSTVRTVHGLQMCSVRGRRTAVVGGLFQFHDRMGRRRKGFFGLKLSQLVEGHDHDRKKVYSFPKVYPFFVQICFEKTLPKAR